MGALSSIFGSSLGTQGSLLNPAWSLLTMNIGGTEYYLSMNIDEQEYYIEMT